MQTTDFTNNTLSLCNKTTILNSKKICLNDFETNVMQYNRPMVVKPEIQKDFEIQSEIFIKMIQTNSISALESTGIVKSLCLKIRHDTICWASQSVLDLIFGLLGCLASNTNIITEHELSILKKHIHHILSNVISLHNQLNSFTNDTVFSLSMISRRLIECNYIDIWEFINNNLVNYVQELKDSLAANTVILIASQCLELSKNTYSADIIVFNRGIHKLVLAALAIIENTSITYKNVTNIQKLMSICNEKQLTGLYDIVFASYITMLEQKNTELFNSQIMCLVVNWAESILDKTPKKYFQGEMNDRVISFTSIIHKFLISHINWNAPYIKLVNYQPVHIFEHYLSFIKYLLQRTSYERTIVASHIEQVLIDNQSTIWITHFAHELHVLILNTLVNCDYLDSNITHLLTLLKKCLNNINSE